MTAKEKYYPEGWTKDIPPPICEICGFEQKDNREIVVYTLVGVLCFPCAGKYEPRLRAIANAACKEEIEKIKIENKELS